MKLFVSYQVRRTYDFSTDVETYCNDTVLEVDKFPENEDEVHEIRATIEANVTSTIDLEKNLITLSILNMIKLSD